MQETENSVPPERLAGSMPLQGLRKPPAVPGGLTIRLLSGLTIHGAGLKNTYSVSLERVGQKR